MLTDFTKLSNICYDILLVGEKYSKINLDQSFDEFIEESELKPNDDANQLNLENIDNSLDQLHQNKDFKYLNNFEVSFNDGYKVKREEADDNTKLTFSGEQMSDVTLEKSHTGELKSIEIESEHDKNFVFNIPESNITIDPFLDGKISSFKNPEQQKIAILKIGTSSITTERGKINYSIIQEFAEIILRLKVLGYAPIIVSSGAKGLGKNLLKGKNCDDISAQCLTSIGQSHLISIYDNIFKNYNLITAQILLAYNDLEYKENIRETIFDLTAHGIIPIINSNDPVICSDNIDIDNDKLAAAIGKILNASHLFIISDSGGLYDDSPDENPNAKIIKHVSEINDEITALANTESGSGLGTGGVKSKIIAAKSCLARGANMVLLSKNVMDTIPEIIKDPDYKFQGTTFSKRKEKIYN